MCVVVQEIHGNIKTHRGFKIEFQPIKCLVHILLHRHDIGQRMNFLSAELADIIVEPFEDSQYGGGVVKLGIQT